MKNIVFFILSVSCIPAWAQKDAQVGIDSVRLSSFNVVDGFYGTSLPQARVTVYDADSTTVLCDSLQKSYYKVGNKDYFRTFTGVLPLRSKYVFKIEAEGYNTLWMTHKLKKSWYGKYPKQFDVIKAAHLYEELNYDIKGAAVVTASRIKFVMKGDTIEYNAAAFRLSAGSMLDNLIRALPGVTLDDKGRIMVNGQFVSNLTVNGRDFFRGDPKVALSNLPAYTVDKVKVFHDRPKDEDNQRSEREKSEDPLVMDVRLKREYAEGWLSNYEVAGGSNLQGGWDEKWLGRFFAMRYTNHSSLALYANVNNLNESPSPGSRGEWRGAGPFANTSLGEKKTYMSGINFSLDPKDTSIRLNTTVQAQRQETLNQTRNNSESYYNEGNTFSHSSSESKTTHTELQWNSRLSTKVFDIQQSTYYNHNKVRGVNPSSQLQANAITPSAIDTLYARERYSLQRETKWGASLGLNNSYGAEIKLGDHGGKVSYNANLSYSRTKAEDDWSDAVSYMHQEERSFVENKHARRPSFDYRYNLGFSYRTPRIIKNEQGGLNFNLSYAYNQNFNSGHQDLTYQNNLLTPSMNDATEWVIDQKNSYHTTRLERQNRIAPQLSFSWKEFGLDVSSELLLQNRRIRDFRNDEHKSYSHQAFNCNPSMSITLGHLQHRNGAHSIGKQATLSASIKNRLPELNYLLDVRDESDPLVKYYGNSSLKAEREYSGSLDLKLMKSKETSWQNYMFLLDYYKYDNSISRAQIYDRTTGVTIFRPQNINGNWRTSANIGIGLEGLPKGFTWSYNLNGYYLHSNEFATTGRDVSASEILSANTLTLSNYIRVSYRIKNTVIGLKTSFECTQMRSEQHVFDKVTFKDFNNGITLSTPLFWGIDFDTDFTAYCRRGYADKSMNTTSWVWNAALSKALGKSKQWIVKAKGFDILHQISNTYRTVNAQGRTETWYNTIPSYATLHIFYRLDVKPKRR